MGSSSTPHVFPTKHQLCFSLFLQHLYVMFSKVYLCLAQVARVVKNPPASAGDITDAS